MSALKRLPAIFLSHGGGPSFFMPPSEFPSHFGDCSAMAKGGDMSRWFSKLPEKYNLNKDTVKAIVVISAHWEGSSQILVTSQQQHKQLLFDYGGFPDYTYDIQWNPPGAPAVSEQIVQLLQSASIPAAIDTKRNFDHGVFVPLKCIWPEPTIPVIEVSIHRNYDPALHYKIGQALAPLREQGILLLGSGEATHDLSWQLQQNEAKQFVAALKDTISSTAGGERYDALLNWEKLPYARKAHPRPDHLIPLMAIAGAGHNDKGSTIYDGWAGKALALTCFAFE